ncbi:hypothetical protein HMPREF9999_00411 [Alloprevotella sp. oral taxon 473 str. F0040]|nr:hypothetical protein HMPREF9999_00411 [Alloprevotella sp. oral taxon 473 str. F0040]
MGNSGLASDTYLLMLLMTLIFSSPSLQFIPWFSKEMLSKLA